MSTIQTIEDEISKLTDFDYLHKNFPEEINYYYSTWGLKKDFQDRLNALESIFNAWDLGELEYEEVVARYEALGKSPIDTTFTGIFSTGDKALDSIINL